MTPLEWIVLATTVGPALIATIRGVFGQKKMSRAQLVQSGYDLAWSAVEGLKKVRPSLAASVEEMTATALDELSCWSKALGLKLTYGEVQCAKMWFGVRSKAAKATKAPAPRPRK